MPTPPPAGDAARLSASLLDPDTDRAEARTEVLPDDLLPGANAEAISLGEVVRRGGVSTLVVLVGLRLLDSLEGQAFAVLSPDIQAGLGLSDTALGAVAGLGAAIFVLAALPLGYLADRRRRTTIAAVCAAVAAGFTLATGLVVAVWQLALARFGVGIGKASLLPVHNSLLADRYPVAGRARVFAAHNLAAPAAAVLGPVLVGGLAAIAGGAEGWRLPFLVLAVPMTVFAVAARFLPEPAHGLQEREALESTDDSSAATANDVPDIPISYATATERLLKIRTLSFLLLGVGVLGFVLVAVPTFLNVLLEDRFGLDALGRGLAVSVTEVGSLLGVLVGGVAGDRLLRRSPPAAIVFLGAGTAVYGLLFTVALFLPGLIPMLLGVSLANFALYAATVPIYAFVAAVVPARLRSLGFALLGIYIFLLGGFLGGIITGLLSDAHGTRFALAVVTAPVCLVAAALASYGARFVRRDMSLVVEELVEERDERRRIRETGADLPVLQVRNLDVSYGPVQVLFGVDLDVARGEVLALLGTNGAGKSTVLRAISGLVLAERGVVRLNGRSITYVGAPERVGLGVVQMPGGKGVFPSLSVTDNLLAGCHRFAWDRPRVRARIEASLELFPQLADLADQAAGLLSGGEQQMLALAKAMLAEPEILLIDELSLGLAPVAVGQLLDVVGRLRDQGVTMMLVEQSVNVALAVADRAVFLERGGSGLRAQLPILPGGTTCCGPSSSEATKGEAAGWPARVHRRTGLHPRHRIRPRRRVAGHDAHRHGSRRSPTVDPPAIGPAVVNVQDRLARLRSRGQTYGFLSGVVATMLVGGLLLPFVVGERTTTLSTNSNRDFGEINTSGGDGVDATTAISGTDAPPTPGADGAAATGAGTGGAAAPSPRQSGIGVDLERQHGFSSDGHPTLARRRHPRVVRCRSHLVRPGHHPRHHPTRRLGHRPRRHGRPRLPHVRQRPRGAEEVLRRSHQGHQRRRWRRRTQDRTVLRDGRHLESGLDAGGVSHVGRG